MKPIRFHTLIATLTLTLSATAWSQSMTDTYTKPEGWKTWCVGRFLIDLPPTAKYAGGRSQYDYYDIETSKDAFAPFMQRIDKVEQDLRAQKHKTEPSMIKELMKFDENGSRGFIYFTFPLRGDRLKTEAYLWKRTGFIIHDRVSIDRVAVASNSTKALAQNLRYRRPEEIPEGQDFVSTKDLFPMTARNMKVRTPASC